MTTPALSVDSAYGRLYRTPGIPTGIPRSKTETWELIETGVLAPSITNVIGVADKPFLKQWAARLAAESAITAALNYPDSVVDRPGTATKWAACEHERVANRAAELGDIVHNACEQIAAGRDPGPIPDEAVPYLNSWESFVHDFQPNFLRLESTVFGHTPEGFAYAGTADFVAEIGGRVFVGDYKTGRRVYDSAALQLAALANASRIVNADGTGLEPNLAAFHGVVVHLAPSGYQVRPASTSPNSDGWEGFVAYRRAWNFHARSLAAREPILMQPAASDVEQLIAAATYEQIPA